MPELFRHHFWATVKSETRHTIQIQHTNVENHHSKVNTFLKTKKPQPFSCRSSFSFKRALPTVHRKGSIPVQAEFWEPKVYKQPVGNFQLHPPVVLIDFSLHFIKSNHTHTHQLMNVASKHTGLPLAASTLKSQACAHKHSRTDTRAVFP